MNLIRCWARAGARLLCVVSAFVGIGSAHADTPTLLTSVQAGGGSTLSCGGPACPAPASGTQGLVFALATDWVGFYGGSQFFGIDASASIGSASSTFRTGDSGYLDFDPTNSNGFAAIASALTNGTPANLTAVSLILLDGTLVNGQPFGGIAGPVQSSAQLLNGAELRFIRLVVNSVEASVRNDGTFGYSFLADVRWEFWGLPAASNVPEPRTEQMFATGLIGLFLLRLATRVRRRALPTQ